GRASEIGSARSCASASERAKGRLRATAAPRTVWVRAASASKSSGHPRSASAFSVTSIRQSLTIIALRVPGYPLCRKAVWASAASVCLLACACMGSTLPGPAGPSTDVPIELALPTITGPPLDVAALRGQVLLIDVMATWSLDSQAQVPLFSKLLAAYRERGLRVVSVAFDSQTPQLVRTWVDTLGVSWPVGLASPEVIEGRSPLGVI